VRTYVRVGVLREKLSPFGSKEVNRERYWTRHWWLRPIILATQEAEIRKIIVHDQLRQKVWEPLSRKYTRKNRAGGMTQVFHSSIRVPA
jgi:hypothetical protein